MSQASIREAVPGELHLEGVLDYRSCPALREEGGRLIAAGSAAAWIVDCSAVEKSSSVGLALLLALLRDALALHKDLTLRGLPEDMRQIAEVCNLTELLPLAE